MIIYVFNNEYLSKITLHSRVSGVYQIFTKNEKFLCNIEANGTEWIIKSTPSIKLIKDDVIINQIKIEEFTLYHINDTEKNITYNVYATLLHDINTHMIETKVEEINIGNNQNCDIVYAETKINDFLINLKFINNNWHLTTQNNEVYVNGIQVKNKILLHGDYIFYYGLRIIVVHNKINVNNPNKKITISSQNFNIYKRINTNPEIEFFNEGSDIVSLYNKDSYFFKSPRFISKIEEATCIIDEPPVAPTENETPLLLVIGPQLTMVAMSLLSFSNYLVSFLEGNTTLFRLAVSFGTVFLTIVAATLWPTLTRKYNAKKNETMNKMRIEKYNEYLEKKQNEILGVKQIQKQILIDNHLPLESIQNIIIKKDRTLWERNIEHDDFLEVRLGLGQVSTKINIEVPIDKFSLYDSDNLEVAHDKLIESSLYIDNVPMSISLTKKNITAIIENDEYAKFFIDGMFLRLCTQHSYTELKIIVFTNKKNEFKWDYLKIMPHTWSNNKTIRYFANNSDDINTISTELEKIFDLRAAQDESEQKESDGVSNDTNTPYIDHKPYFLIFSDDIENIRNVPFIKKLRRYKVNYGFSLLMLNDCLATLPNETKTFLNITKTKSGMISNEITNSDQKEFTADFNTNINMYECAQKLANIPIHVDKEKYELPSSLSFLELYNVGKVEHLNCLDKWRENNPVNSLAVPIGIDQNGETFKMDIHEKEHGPHGLVAGTTGSGKSEWIVTYILSLAVNFSPEEIQFVLIDYKGGGLAMSFENAELGIKLPHIAGIITNLDKSAINRSIDSIESELKRRQNIFNETREKLKEGSMNIYKYQELYRQKLVDEPMSHLLIISDEFAELKQQQPEFMQQLISTSRIGRSLGVHLILATQKPTGVVNDQIWSNSKFKVCLKVQNKADSNEILKKPDAAFLKTAGSFYLSVGNDDYYNLGQSAWAGAKYFPSESGVKKIDEQIYLIDDLGKTINTYSNEVKDISRVSKGEELINIVSYINDISKKENHKLIDLWLPNVAPISYINEVIKNNNHTPIPYVFDIPIGEYDEPRRQEQGILKLNLQNNVAIIGQTGSGKDSLISTILWTTMTTHIPQSINIYIIDYGSETLKKFAKFPHVGEIVYQDDQTKVFGILDIILSELDKRKEIFENYNGSFDYYNKFSETKVPLINLIIHGYDIFCEQLPKLTDFLNTLLRDCPKYGIYLTLTCSTANGIRVKQLQYINSKIVMQLPDHNSYRSITNCRKGLIPSKVFGRGICKLASDDDSYAEFQTSIISDPDTEYELIKTTGIKLAEYYKYKAKELPKIPDTLTSEDLVKYITDLSDVPIGFDFHEKEIYKYNLLDRKIHIISSRNIKESLNSINGIINILSKINNVKIRIVDLLKLYTNQNLDVKVFNDNFDAIFGALENDVLTRTDQQPIGINIIIGAGSYKKKLTAAGTEIADNMFNNINKSKNIIYIILDNYDELRMLKVEPWFSQVDLTSGLWLGPNLSNQSLLASNELTMDDKKLNFDGIGYSIQNSTYSIIKTVLDGDE